MPLKIPNGGSEPLYSAGLLDAAGTLLTGLVNVLLRIRRDSDGFYYDFADDTFKASPGTIEIAMTEVDATELPGVYRYEFDLGIVTNETLNDVYHFRINAASAVNQPQEGIILTTDLAAKAGWGDRTFTATVEDSVTAPIAGATVIVRGSTGLPVVGRNTTDVDGEATFLLDDGSYLVYVYSQGYAFSNPFSLTITGDSAATYTGTGDGSSSITPPESPDVCRVFGYFMDLAGDPIQGVKVLAELSSRSAYVLNALSGTLIAKPQESTVSDADGLWQLDLIPNALLTVEPDEAVSPEAGATDTQYRFTFQAPGMVRKQKQVTVPDESTADFKTLI